MLFRWMPVPGTMTPEPQPVEEESDAALPSTSTTLTWVVRAAPPVPVRSLVLGREAPLARRASHAVVARAGGSARPPR